MALSQPREADAPCHNNGAWHCRFLRRWNLYGPGALDARTEAQLLIALDEVMKGRTTFVIAHRLSTIRKATNILVFDAGRIIEYGTFDELLARNGAFAELARAQYLAPAAEVKAD